MKTSESNRVELSLEDEVVDGFEGLNAVDIEVKTTTEGSPGFSKLSTSPKSMSAKLRSGD